ncbi:MAG: AMP-binding protein [Ignavibacteriaceae bacterium]
MYIKKVEKTALVWQNNKITYDELLRHINFYSSLFSGEKVTKAAIFSSNRPEWCYAFYAAWKNNVVAVPIDSLAPADEVAYMLNDCRPEIIFCSQGTLETFIKARKLLKYEITLFVFEEQNYNCHNYTPEEIISKSVFDTAVIIYTSGTTGNPKGVMLSYDNLLANVEAVSIEIPIFTEDRNVLALLPLHHIFPLIGTLIAPLFVGATIAMSPSMTSEDIIDTLQKNQIAITIGVPRLYSAIHQGIMKQINKSILTKVIFKLAGIINSRSFSKLIFKKVHEKFGGHIEYMVCGGAKLDEDLARDFKTLGFEMLEGFGMTEAAPMITFTHPGKWKIGSAGLPLSCLEVETKDGEIVARGRNIMQGYYNRPEETAEVLKEGWLHTGDLGYLDNEGFIHITGRSKEIIVLSNGKNINPEEIENKIKDISDLIVEVGVFMQNDILTAVIYPDFKKLAENSIQNIEEVFRWEVIDKYNHSVSSYKKINKFILYKDELPKTRLGKIQRFKLAAIINENNGIKKRMLNEPQFEEYLVIRDFLKEQKKNDISPDDHFEIDLGLDSLDKVNLHVFLESTFGIKIQNDILIYHPTVEKLSQFMKEKKNRLTVETVKWAEIFKEKIELKLPKSWFTQNLFKNTSKILFKLYFRLKGEGTENLPEGPFIIAPNHQSFFDGLFVSMFLKNKVMKNTYFYAKEKHLRNPWVKALANRNNVIIMDLNRDLKESLQKLAEVLRKGKNIIIFPEGTRTRTGSLGEFKKSFAILSHELNVPIVPVSIEGAYNALPRGSFIPRPWKKINVKFHKPVYPDGQNYESLVNIVRQRLSKELA